MKSGFGTRARGQGISVSLGDVGKMAQHQRGATKISSNLFDRDEKSRHHVDRLGANCQQRAASQNGLPAQFATSARV